ncbi:GspE/PulE family protein [Anaerosinus massiliensis]|uniref:GspE/PulE family protein n=1 Tax=Massilibacillus massiliensis TaxID=1806837 RepID=UPI000A647A73|nr:GspE/PulE family protein [Massilibacillus massiliensis]
MMIDQRIVNDRSIIEIVDEMIKKAICTRASDIHIEPTDQYLRIRFRVDGALREVSSFPLKLHLPFISRLKIMGELDIAEKRLPQDGRIIYKEDDRAIDLRISTMPTILGEKIVLRILDKSLRFVDIQKMGFSEGNLRKYVSLYKKPYGMILNTGPTGSGKTTTLYGTLSELNDPSKNIVTIENPVEYRLDGINQIQINSKIDLSFSKTLRSVLRQDPNIIMIGEIRDRETARIAIHAAQTGHLVFSTLHTNHAIGAITRLVDIGIEPFLVSSSILGIVAQRLVRLICPKCKISYKLDESVEDRETLEPYIKNPNTVLYKGRGCCDCNFTGYYGQTAIHEVLPMTKKIRNGINRQVSAEQLKEFAVEEGFVSMQQDGMQKVLTGQTTIQEILRLAYEDSL